MRDSDLWVCRTAVRQLNKLVTAYPTQTFRLLRETVTSKHEWICLESARVLAHYFDVHQDELADGIHDLLHSALQRFVIEQIAHNAVEPLVRDLFTLLALLKIEPGEEQHQALFTLFRLQLPQPINLTSYNLSMPCMSTKRCVVCSMLKHSQISRGGRIADKATLLFTRNRLLASWIVSNS